MPRYRQEKLDIAALSLRDINWTGVLSSCSMMTGMTGGRRGFPFPSESQYGYGFTPCSVVGEFACWGIPRSRELYVPSISTCILSFYISCNIRDMFYGKKKPRKTKKTVRGLHDIGLLYIESLEMTFVCVYIISRCERQ